MKRGSTSPPHWRIFAAFLVAPMLAAIVLACLGPMWASLPDWLDRAVRTAQFYALFYAYPATALLGVPAFLILMRVMRVSLVNCLAVGAGVAALPLLMLFVVLPNPVYAYSNGHVTVQNGVRTLDGWIDVGKLAASIALLGAFAGAIFWMIAAAGLRKIETVHEPTSKTPQS